MNSWMQVFVAFSINKRICMYKHILPGVVTLQVRCRSQHLSILWDNIKNVYVHTYIYLYIYIPNY